MQITGKSLHFAWKHLFCFRKALFLIPFLFVFSAVKAQIWEDFTVWYDGNGADSGHISEVNYKSGSNDVILKENASSEDGSDSPYEKNGCTFIGWSLEPAEGSVITPVLQAGTVWDPVDVPITWIEDRNGFVFYARWECDPDLVQPTAEPTDVIAPGDDPDDVLDDTDELQFTDECMARQMVKVIKDTYNFSEFQVKREIECVRRIYYGGNKMLMWQNFPERLKVIFENV